MWSTDKPFIVFMVPSEGAVEYASAMNRLLASVIDGLNWSSDSVEALGLIAATKEHGTEGILFLEEMGIDTRSITMLILWGETAACVGFEDRVSEICGVGTVVLPETGVFVPTLRMPSLDGGWWDDGVNQEYAAMVFASVARNGREEVGDEDALVFVSRPNVWN